MSRNSSLRILISDSLHSLLGFSDSALEAYVLTIFTTSKTKVDVIRKMKEDINIDTTTTTSIQMIDKIWSHTAGSHKTNNKTNNKQKRQKEKIYDMLDEHDNDEDQDQGTQQDTRQLQHDKAKKEKVRKNKKEQKRRKEKEENK